MTELSPSAMITPETHPGYLIGVRNLEGGGAREAADWRVFPDADACRRSRIAYPARGWVELFYAELSWLTAEQGHDAARWYIAVAQRKPHRLEVAHHDFRDTVAEVQRDIDALRESYPEYAAGVMRFVVCEVREIGALAMHRNAMHCRKEA
jgi:hypothetical protein